VGLKIHCLGDGSQFSTLVEGLGGAQKILDVNYYKHSHASLCLVLPPVGSARSAILLLECIEHFIGSALFSNPEIQIQVCSPGRLGARRSALLAKQQRNQIRAPDVSLAAQFFQQPAKAYDQSTSEPLPQPALSASPRHSRPRALTEYEREQSRLWGLQ
jgi:hypothetical protein